MKQKNRMTLILIFACLALTTACKDEPATEATERKDGYTKNLKSKQDSLFQEVMDGHDVGMAKMGQISGYLKTIKSSLDSTRKQKSVNKNTITVLESVSADLSQADYSMNRWMEEFKLDSAENNEPVRIAYLESEKDKINKIKERILNSLKRADSLYGKGTDK
ncbi:MAG: viral A-type inclusion protein [Chitinophagaceae bacterium]|nr:MAG: viral A-type inclusion protein [Chitinophagaceae bacterium]